MALDALVPGVPGGPAAWQVDLDQESTTCAQMQQWWVAWHAQVVQARHRLLCRFSLCEVDDAEPVCPPGVRNMYEDCPDGAASCYRCPAHRDCYQACTASQWGSWISAPGSPYNGQAFCERFPRLDEQVNEPPEEYDDWTYLAQTGKAIVARHNFDNIYNSIITIFQILTGALVAFAALAASS